MTINKNRSFVNDECNSPGQGFVFINLSIDCGFNSGINHGIAYLVPIVRKYFADVTCLNVRSDISNKQFKTIIQKLNPCIVGFSATSNQLKYLKKYSNEFSSISNVLQIAGGVGPTLDPEWVLSETHVDGVCIGEGEIPLDGLLLALKNKRSMYEIEGFYWKGSNSKIIKNNVPQFTSDLSTLNFPDYTVFDKNLFDDARRIFVMLSRGCPYDCFFCCNKTLSNVYPSPTGYFRLPSVEYAISLLQMIIKQHQGTSYIEFEDDLLIANSKWFKEFSLKYKSLINIPYRMNARVECITPDIVNALKYSGCDYLFLGLETGNETFRKTILNKQFSNELFLDKCNIIKRSGIKLFLYNVIGFPFEGENEMRDTLSLNKLAGPNSGVCTFFYPYKNTKLHETCRVNGLLKIKDEAINITNYNTRPAIKMSLRDEKLCFKYQRKMTSYFNMCKAKTLFNIETNSSRVVLRTALILITYLLFEFRCVRLISPSFKFFIRKMLNRSSKGKTNG